MCTTHRLQPNFRSLGMNRLINESASASEKHTGAQCMFAWVVRRSPVLEQARDVPAPETTHTVIPPANNGTGL